MVICGATGDLTERKLAPALYNLLLGGFLPPEFTVVGFARREMSDDAFRDHLREGVDRYSRNRPDQGVDLGVLRAGIQYHHGSFDDPEAWAGLSTLLDRIDRDRGTAGNRLFYLAVPPTLYPVIVASWGRPAWRSGRRSVDRSQGLVPRHRREAVRLRPGQRQAAQSPRSREVFDEDQIYRIDHYLGKETVQNLAVFRFGNGLFEPIWNRRYIDSVQITVSETVGVEGRGEFYDQTGALRDIVQNHALQLLAMFAMEPPVEFQAADLRDEKLKVLRAVRSHVARRGGPERGARPVRVGLGGGPQAALLPRRARGPPRLGGGDLRGAEAGDRLLALGRRAVLPAHRQGAADAG